MPHPLRARRPAPQVAALQESLTLVQTSVEAEMKMLGTAVPPGVRVTRGKFTLDRSPKRLSSDHTKPAGQFSSVF